VLDCVDFCRLKLLKLSVARLSMGHHTPRYRCVLLHLYIYVGRATVKTLKVWWDFLLLHYVLLYGPGLYRTQVFTVGLEIQRFLVGYGCLADFT
jgi:hypothetical protein